MQHRKGRTTHPKRASQSRIWFTILFIVCLSIVGIVSLSYWYAGSTTATSRSALTVTSTTQQLAQSNTWTRDTSVQIYNRLNGQWEAKTYGDVLPDTEFIVENAIYATTPGQGMLFAKPELNVARLAETDRAFEPNHWRMPQLDDIVFLVKTNTHQQKGHWLLRDVQSGSEIVFQGRVWSWNLDSLKQHFVIKDTGNVLARVTATHVNVHEGDVLALTVKLSACGKTGLITGSEEHPFYVLDTNSYLPMVQLKPGMQLKTSNGSQVTVVTLEPLTTTLSLYNLTVEHVHNFYIYPSERDPGILVHNAGCGKVPLIGGSTNLPEGVQWAKVDQLQHPSWNPPDVQKKIDLAKRNLASGFDPNHAIGVIIEPNGTMMVAEGNHRLSVVREMGYDEVPIRVLLDKR